MEVHYQFKSVANEASSRVVQDACVNRKRLLEEENCGKQCCDGRRGKVIFTGQTNVSSNDLNAGSKSSEDIKAGSPKTSDLCFSKRKRKRERIVLKSHIKVIAGNPPIYKCDICKKSFKTKAHVYYHDFCSGKDRPLQCDICESSFITKAHLQYHLRTHSGEPPFVCRDCGEGFSQKWKMNQHICHSGAAELISIAGIPCDGTGMYSAQQTPSTSGVHTAPISRSAAVERELEARLQSLNSYWKSQEMIQTLKLKTAEVQLAIMEQQRRHNEEQFALDKKIKEELFTLDKKIKEEQLRELQVKCSTRIVTDGSY